MRACVSTAVAVVLMCVWMLAATAAEKPNVLFVAVDDLNCDLECYGHPQVKSPNVDRLAARGVRFDKAYCQYPVCNPSRSSFLTGLYPEQTGVLSNADSFRARLPDVVTLPQQFQKHGYFVARVGKLFHYGVPAQIGTAGADDPASWNHAVNPRGIDKDVEGEIHTLQPGQFGGTLSWLRVESDDRRHTDGIGASAMIDLLAEHHPQKTGKPFFLAMGFYRPHTPYVAPAKYFDWYPRETIVPVLERPGDRDDIPPAALFDRPKQRDLTVPERQEIIQAYFASVSFMDAQLGRLLDALRDQKLEESTIVVFVSDHGYHLGAHGLWQKSDLFEGSCRVPLIVAVPGTGTAGRTAGGVVELVDLYPTLAELCGLPIPAHAEGKSLVPLLNDPQASVRSSALTVTVIRDAAIRRENPGKQLLGHTLRTGRYRYTEWGAGEFGTELYDYETDPEEFTNLARSEAHREVLGELQAELRQRREAAKRDPR